jgi:hypothetical protein
MFVASVSFLVPAYLGWRAWEWLGPTSWIFGEGFVWFCVKVVIATGLVGAGTRLAFLALMVGGSAIASALGPRK